MKQVLRESLWLLSGGQYLSFLDDRESIFEVSLTYADFAALRPKFSASSWRGAMLKAQQRGWVHRRAVSGDITFQLTKTGREWVSADFQAFRQFLAGKKNASFLAFKLAQAKKSGLLDASFIRSLLLESGGVALQPGLWAFPTGQVSDLILTKLRRSGYLTLVLEGSKATTQYSQDIFAWVQEKRTVSHEVSRTSLEEISKQINSLLALLESKKTLHHLQISQIGSLLVSTYSEMMQLSWLDLEDEHLLESVFSSLQASDAVIALWLRRKAE